ncbi:hypothetical protein [Lacticigenium naphthae]|uniref:hypothetical protein n=1 Tax=Lacticigenium naphthae TaxID=515351 RepID=UPI0003F5337B|nr:hypothetical protein [Lacticigenium naphthae]
MMENESTIPGIDFYRDRDEKDFLERWEEQHGELSEEELDDLYEEIGKTIHELYTQKEIILGTNFEYKKVLVGEVDYNRFYNIYLFQEPK